MIKYWQNGEQREIDRQEVIFTDRSRVEDRKSCETLWWYRYKDGPEGRGITGVLENEDLVTGKATHAGLEQMVGMAAGLVDPSTVEKSSGMVAHDEMMELYREGKLGISGDPTLLQAVPELAEMLAEEQAWMAYAFVWVFERRWLEWLMDEYEVLSVEEEIAWKLGEVNTVQDEHLPGITLHGVLRNRPIIMLSRLDAVGRNRQTGRLTVLEYKTKKEFDQETIEDLPIKEQGLAQMAAVWHRYGEWPDIQYFYFTKGDKRLEKETQLKRYGNSLIRPYSNYDGIGDAEAINFGFSFDYTKADGTPGKLGPKWKRRDIWQEGEIGVPAWLEMLDLGLVQPKEERDWLSEVVSKPDLIEANPDWVARWIRGAVRSEQLAVQVGGADEAMMTEGACRKFRSPCAYRGICYGGQTPMDLLVKGKMTVREPNHPMEFEEEILNEV